jgi:hypothetical protein
MCVCDTRMTSRSQVSDKHDLWKAFLTWLASFSRWLCWDGDRGQMLIPGSCMLLRWPIKQPLLPPTLPWRAGTSPPTSRVQSRLADERTMHQTANLRWTSHLQAQKMDIVQNSDTSNRGHDQSVILLRAKHEVFPTAWSRNKSDSVCDGCSLTFKELVTHYT